MYQNRLIYLLFNAKAKKKKVKDIYIYLNVKPLGFRRKLVPCVLVGI